VAGSEGARGMLAQAVNSNFQGFRQQPIVCVKKNQVFTSAFFECFVSSRRNTRIFLANVPYAPKAGSYFRGVVGGTIVDNENLAMRIRLSQSALNRFMQKMRLIIARDYDRNQTGLRCE
jgi:hypothetical protein